MVDARAKAGDDGKVYHYTWRLKLRMLIDDEHRIVVIDNKGKPFVTVDQGPGSRNRQSLPWD